MKRRDFINSLAGIPVIGGFLAAFAAQSLYQRSLEENILSELDLKSLNSGKNEFDMPVKGDLIRLGIIGIGSRGTSILESLGFGRMRNANDSHSHLNVHISGVCDVYDVHAEKGIAMSGMNAFSPNGKEIPEARRFKYYQDMLASDQVDAVIIATPDHWHAQMLIDAVQAGKHVYCEKCLTRTIEEAYQVRNILADSAIKFQYGHQNRQQNSYDVAREFIGRDLLGKISVIKTHTNRNNKRGAWIRHLGKENTDSGKVDWSQWLGVAPNTPFTPDRFYGWQKWFEYSGGLPAHMFSHEYDALNQVLDLGIPASVVASGGIYYWKDSRNTPDVMQAVFDYPDKELVMTYDATLASSSTGMYESGAKVKELFGSDAWMRMGMNIDVIADRHSKKYKSQILQGKITPNIPFISYYPGRGTAQVDAVTSASEKLYASQGLIYTYKDGKKIDVTYLHLREWLQSIRHGGVPCGTIKTAFEDTITCLMATKAYREKRRVIWDPVQEQVA